MRKKIILSITVTIFIISLILFLTKPQTSVNNQTFQIMDKETSCYEALEEIMRDETYVYYLPCKKKDKIIIQFSNQKEYSLQEVLENKMLTIDELIENGLKVRKYLLEDAITEDYIETVPENAKDFINLIEDNAILLTPDEITKYNEKMKEKADMVYDINQIHSLTKQEILTYINSYQIPSLPKYDGKRLVTQKDTETILENRNLNQVEDKESIQKGIIVKRANLKSFPTYIHFYNSQSIENFDSIQETELLVNTPVLILHESKDQEWNFVISPFYVGWVEKENIVPVTETDYDFFINNKSFGIITEAGLEIENTKLDMSVKLPYLGVVEEGYQFLLPQKQEDGTLTSKLITIDKAKAHIGYLPYTKRNVYIQAFKYEGVNYSWSGMNQGVDCSSYVSNIYRSFGIFFPRNTSSQNKSVGKIISLKDQTPSQKLETIKNNNPALLYQSGHVMLYLGMKDIKHYMIHASGSEMKVVVTELTEDSSYIKSIDKLVLVDNSFIE